MAGRVTIHTKKYYRVVIEDFNRARDTEEAFAIKIGLSLRVPLPRARIIARNLPAALGTSLSATDANRLKAVLEKIGARARIEAHLVTPGEATEVLAPAPGVRLAGRPEEGGLRCGRTPGTVVCPSCGWEVEEEAEYCPLCLRRFRRERLLRADLGEMLPEKNPLADEAPPSVTINLAELRRYALPLLFAALAIVAFILLK